MKDKNGNDIDVWMDVVIAGTVRLCNSRDNRVLVKLPSHESTGCMVFVPPQDCEVAAALPQPATVDVGEVEAVRDELRRFVGSLVDLNRIRCRALADRLTAWLEKVKPNP